MSDEQGIREHIVGYQSQSEQQNRQMDLEIYSYSDWQQNNFENQNFNEKWNLGHTLNSTSLINFGSPQPNHLQESEELGFFPTEEQQSQGREIKQMKPESQQDKQAKARNKNMPAFFGRIIYNQLDDKTKKSIKTKPTTLEGISKLIKKKQFQEQGEKLLSSFEIIDIILSSHHQIDVESPLGLINQLHRSFKTKTKITSFASK